MESWVFIPDQIGYMRIEALWEPVEAAQALYITINMQPSHK